ncbi:Ig-like domain-containing protein [Mycobacterium antarcticum]
MPNGVMGNDSDPDDDAALTATVITPPTHGVLNFDSNGAFTYTPAANYHGTDTFTYRTFDGTLNSNTATVTINVTSVNDAPIANPDTYTTAEDTPLTVAIPNGVMGNDSDPDDDAALTATVITPPTHGVLNFDSNGAFTYTPAANYHGTDTFTYRTFDGTLNSNTATVTINVTSVNDAPIAADDAYTVGAGRALTVTAAGVLTNDTDVDSGAVLTATVVQGPAHGTMALSADGTFTYTPSSGFSGTDFFIYTVSDNTNLTDTGVVTIAVTPITASDDAFTVLMDTSTVLSPALGANDTSVTGLEMGAITIVDAPTHGSVQVNPDGTVTYRPYNDYRGTDTFTYTVEDGNGLGIVSNTATVTVTVISPIIANDDAYTVLMNGPTVLSPGLAANDTRYPGTNFDLGAITIVTAPTHGSVQVNPDGTVTYRPYNDYRGTDTFTYTLGAASPGIPASNTATVTVTVISPIIATDDAYTVLMNGPTVLSPGLAANDTRYPGTNFDLGNITIVTAPTHGSATANPDGTVTYGPFNGYRGTDTFTYTLGATNTFIPASNTATVTVTVVPQLPAAVNDTATVAEDSTANTITVLANDDVIYAGFKPVRAVSDPAHGAALVTADGATIIYTPDPNFDGGIDTFTYTLDGGSTATVTVYVTPNMITTTVGRPDANGTVTGTALLNNPVPGFVGYAITGAPTQGYVTVNADTGVFTYTPTNASRLAATAITTDTFTITASDVPRTAAEIVAVPVSPAAFTFTGTITVGPSPAAVAVSPAGTQLYFADTGGSVSVFDRATNTVTDTIPVGSNPVDMAISPNGRFLYVANQGSASVSVIDTATNALTRTITVGSIPTSVAVSPDGTRVYVANQGSASVSVIDTTINTVAATIAVGSGPMAVAVTPDGQRLYVANSNSNTVSVIDTATDTITHTIAVGGSPDAVAVSPDGQRVYVANRTSGSVSVINTATNTVTRTIAVENLPGAMAITPDGKRVYVANYASRSVSVIDTATDTVTDTIRAWSGPVSPVAVEVAPSGTLLYIIDTSGSVLVIDTDNNTFAGTPIPVGSSPVSAAVSPSSATVYVVNNGSNTVSVIDTTTITVTNTIAVGGSPNAVAASPDGQRVYVANRTSGSVSVINTTTDTVTHTIPVGTLPAAVVVSPDGMQLYVANSYSPFANSLSETVLVIDTATNTVTGSVSVGSPGGLAVSPDGKLLYVTNFDDDTVSVIDTRTSTILDTITVGTFPTELAVSPDGGRLYVINQLGYTVSVIDTTTATVTVTIPVGSTRVAVAVSPDGSLLYVTSFDDDTVSVIDTATNSVIRVIPVGSRPAAVAVNADGTQVFVANQSSNTVSVISLT